MIGQSFLNRWCWPLCGPLTLERSVTYPMVGQVLIRKTQPLSRSLCVRTQSAVRGVDVVCLSGLLWVEV